MIALLAAVPEETHLIRQSLQGGEVSLIAGLEVWQGHVRGRRIVLTHAGIGKAAAAAATMTLLLKTPPEELWLFGCGGAYPSGNLAIGDLALATAEIFGDEGALTPGGFRDLAQLGLPMRSLDSEQRFNTWPVDADLLAWAQTELTPFATQIGCRLACGPFVTVSTGTGTSAAARPLQQRTAGLCENMEGAAVALACRQAGIRLLELRGISNLVEDRDPSAWNLTAGMTIAQRAILHLLDKRAGF